MHYTTYTGIYWTIHTRKKAPQVLKTTWTILSGCPGWTTLHYDWGSPARTPRQEGSNRSPVEGWLLDVVRPCLSSQWVTCWKVLWSSKCSKKNQEEEGTQTTAVQLTRWVTCSSLPSFHARVVPGPALMPGRWRAEKRSRNHRGSVHADRKQHGTLRRRRASPKVLNSRPERHRGSTKIRSNQKPPKTLSNQDLSDPTKIRHATINPEDLSAPSFPAIRPADDLFLAMCTRQRVSVFPPRPVSVAGQLRGAWVFIYPPKRRDATTTDGNSMKQLWTAKHQTRLHKSWFRVRCKMFQIDPYVGTCPHTNSFPSLPNTPLIQMYLYRTTNHN